ncbi:MAG: S8 family serine peptidase [Planctomycetes bacterium]|nr:S8 family serine peptidase [Planctomycetota bacterium]
MFRRRIDLAALLVAFPTVQDLPAPALTPGEPAPASLQRNMGTPGFAPAVLPDEVPRPEKLEVRVGQHGDELVARETQDPFFLGFAGGRYFPPADERLDPELVAAALAAQAEGRTETYGFVMFQKRMTPERGAELEARGVRLLQFHPHYCLKVALPIARLDEIAALDFVRWVGVPRTAHKLHPALASTPVEADGRLALYVDVYESDLCADSTSEPIASAWLTDGGVSRRLEDQSVLPRRWQSHGPAQRALEALGVEVVEYVDEVRAFRVRCLPSQVEGLTALDRVQFVEPDLPASLAHDESTPMIGADFSRWYFPGNSSGTNAVAQADSGIDPTHQALAIAGIGWDFTGIGTPYTDGCEHGSHVLGTVLGDGSGSFWNSNKGVAPGLARGGSATRAYIARIFDNGCNFASTTNSAIFSVNRTSVFDGIGNTSKPQLSCNSWGTVGTGWVGTEVNSRAVDSEVWNYDQLYVFAAGNNGLAGAQSVTQQGVAKNALTVGNVIDFYASYGFPNTIAFDSGRGPCADGRWKPNVVAPGDSVTSVDANSGNGYKALAGTSMATPHVAGLAAQMTDTFAWMRYQPAALMATLMSSAESKGGAALVVPTDPQLDIYGAGKVSAHKGLLGSSEYWINNWVFNATWLGGWTFGDFSVPANCKRMTVCLTYVEPEASAGASQALINNWDLYLDDPSNGIDPAGNSGEWFVHQSAIDNVEIRTLDNPLAGTWRWKAWPQSVNFLSSVKASVTVTYELETGAAQPALDVWTNATYLQPNQAVDVFASVSNAHGLASGASFESTSSGDSLQYSQGQLFDGPYTDHMDNPASGRKVMVGDLPPGGSRTVFWRTSWATEGVKNFGSYLDLDNASWQYDAVTLTVDGTPPPHPSISSTSHSQLVWSNDNTIDFTWAQSPDNVSGLAGYAALISSNGIPLDPGHSINLAPVTSQTFTVPSSAAAIYLSLRPVDNAGNASVNGYAWSPPYLVDAVAPGTPGPISSSSHSTGVMSCNTTVSLSWQPTTDVHSGLAGYIGVWDTSPSTIPSGAANLGLATSLVQNIGSSTLPRWFHLRARDNAGNMGFTAHFGPVYANANSVSTYCTAKTNSLGCVPSIGTNGVQPDKSAGNFSVTCTNVLNQKNGLLFWSFSPTAAPFQGGTKCVNSPSVRTATVSSGGPVVGTSCTGAYGFTFTTAYMNAQGLVPGNTLYAQWWMRDPASSFSTGLSNGLSFTICD